MSQNQPDASALHEGCNAKTPVPEVDGAVTHALFLNLLLKCVRGDAPHHRRYAVCIQHIGVQPPHSPVLTNDCWLPGRQMQLGRVDLDDPSQEDIDQRLT
jgi:hypothetical protein